MKNLLYISIAIFLLSCGDANNQLNYADASIKGKLSNSSGQTIFLEALGTKAINIVDSTKVQDDGEFAFDYQINKTSFYRIRISGNNFFNLILNPSEKVEVTADASNMAWTYQVAGSDESVRLQKLNGFLSNTYSKNDSLNNALRQHQQRGDAQSYVRAVNYQRQLNEKMYKFLRQFVVEKPASLASLAAVNKLNPENDFDYLKKVADGLSQTMPESEYYTQLAAQVKELSKLAVGGEAPEMALPDPNGNIITLSSLRGNVVLVDFWASWCKPCRIENPNVVRVYQKYHDKGFEILGVSLDKNKNQWLAAINQDGLIWKHISDLRAWQSSVVPLYNVKGIPLAYLLDREGKIIAKNLRGQQLDQKLAEIFGE
ncbi:MAG: hypothetical protein COA57_00200 [Flavobacteriales bacterium]|nr:MAG: hypothetical protein COA57_00200 [Flavobacteriales bacterium]